MLTIKLAIRDIKTTPFIICQLQKKETYPQTQLKNCFVDTSLLAACRERGIRPEKDFVTYRSAPKPESCGPLLKLSEL